MNNSSVYAIIVTDEIIEAVKHLEPMVIGEIKKVVDDETKAGWTMIGAAMMYQAVMDTLEKMKTVVAVALMESNKPEDVQ